MHGLADSGPWSVAPKAPSEVLKKTHRWIVLVYNYKYICKLELSDLSSLVRPSTSCGKTLIMNVL